MAFAWRCKACKAAFPGGPREKPYVGPCPKCGRTRDAERVSVSEDDVKGAQLQPIKEGEIISLADAIAQAEHDHSSQAIKTGSPGLDWVLDGGIPTAIAILISSPPGAGKTTFLIETLRKLAKKIKVLYCSSEETTRQLGKRFARLAGKTPEKLLLLAERDFSAIEEAILNERPKIAVVDSVHMLSDITDDNGFTYSSGSIRAMTLAGDRLRTLASELNMTIFCVVHVDKTGNISGANTLQHELDLTLYINGKQEMRDGRLVIVGKERTLRCDGKNRYSETGRCARFQMLADGFHDCGPWVDDRPPWVVFNEKVKEQSTP